MTALELAQELRQAFDGLLAEPVEFRGEITLQLGEASRMVEVCRHAKSRLGFDYLVDISSVDCYGDDPRFVVVYELYSYQHRCHLRLKAAVTEEKSELPTVTAIWRGAEWHEREVYDLMGIRFAGHPDLRRVLMWEGYPDHPLRKDFPLSGRPSETPEVAFSRPAPLEGGPFVTQPGGGDTAAREPRARTEEEAQ
jgi:NADH-quinone oxidoreductase subunit C